METLDLTARFKDQNVDLDVTGKNVKQETSMLHTGTCKKSDPQLSADLCTESPGLASLPRISLLVPRACIEESAHQQDFV